MINDVKKRRSRKEAALGESLSGYFSKAAALRVSYESEIRKSGGNVGLLVSTVLQRRVCVYQCVFPCAARERLISLCPCGLRLRPGLLPGRLTAEV